MSGENAKDYPTADAGRTAGSLSDRQAREPRTLRVLHLGTMSYAKALELQQRLVDQRLAEEIPDTLVIVEHPPVITLGRSASDTDILLPRDLLEQRGVEIHRVTRGGLVTYHGPGQLVGYPIVHLYERAREIKRFIHTLEDVFIDVLGEHYGVSTSHDPHERGVWIGGTRKITAVGIAIVRRVTMHGFAFNVCPDLSHFNWIVPCGIADRGVTSLSLELGREVSLTEASEHVVETFRRRFAYRDLYHERLSERSPAPDHSGDETG